MKVNWESIQLWGWRSIKIALLLAVVGAAGYWYFAAIPVVAYKVQTGDLVAEVMGTGTLEARLKSTISPKISGRLHEVPVDQGSKVQSGDLLFSLDDAELLQQVEMAQATTALWIASLDRLQADHNQAKAVLEAEQAGFGRVQALIERKAASADDLDHATESLRIAEAGLLRADAAMLEGKKQITAAEKTLNYHEARLADTRVVAPFDGLVVKRYRDPGDIGVPGSPILLLVSTNEIWVSAWVDETEMSRLHQDQLARVRIRSDSGIDHDGKVSRLGLEADRETREFLVDVQVLTLPENWAVGQRAEVFIEVARRTAVPLLPSRFVTWRETTPGVYVQTENRAIWQQVKLGLQGEENVEITDGVAVGEIVLLPVTDKSLSLENQRITVAK